MPHREAWQEVCREGVELGGLVADSARRDEYTIQEASESWGGGLTDESRGWRDVGLGALGVI